MHVWCCCQCLCSLTVRLSLWRPDFRSGLIILRPRSDRVSLFFFFMHIGLRYRFYTGPFVTKTHFPHSTAPQVFRFTSSLQNSSYVDILRCSGCQLIETFCTTRLLWELVNASLSEGPLALSVSVCLNHTNCISQHCSTQFLSLCV